MKLRHKIAGAALLLAVGAVVTSMIVLSYESPCAPPPPLQAGVPSMKAIVHRCYGSPDVLALESVAKPSPGDNEVLVKVRAASVNALDWHNMRGEPYVMRLGGGFGLPKNVRLGVDFAGTVEAVGKNVTRFARGDEVFGGRGGSLAEYVTVGQDWTIARKPTTLTFEQAAAMPVAAVTALQALRDKGRIQPGQRVLINGASGGVGTFAVQIAKSFGADVTGVCSTRNLELVKSIGADHVIDYTRENFTRGTERYDVIVDIVGSHSVSDYRRVLKPGGVFVVVGTTSRGRWLGPLTGLLAALVYDPFVDQDLVAFFARLNGKDLQALHDLAEAGKLTSVIDRRYAASEIPAAIRYFEEGHSRGKVVVQFD